MVEELPQDTAIEKTPLWEDVKDILSSENQTVRWTYHAMFHTVDEDVPVGQLLHWEENRDYAGMVGASGHVSFNLGMGDYQYRLYPYRGHMELSIKKIALNTDGTEKEEETDTQRFKVIFHPELNYVPSGGKDALYDHMTLNNTEILTVKLEIQDRALEPLRRTMVSGTYRSITLKRLIRGLMVGVSKRLEVEGKPIVDGLEFEDPDNQDVQKEVVIPQGTLLSNFPTWCQEKGAGVYSTGIGTFFQRFDKKNLWFVFPFYKFKRFDTCKKKLVIYNVPSGKLNGIDKTYKVDGDVLKIITVNGTRINDDATNTELNSGVGFRLTNDKAVMAKPVQIKDGKAVYNRSRMMTEVAYKEREDGLNYAPYIKPGTNPFSQYSKAFLSRTQHITLGWENADPDLLFPGMPCKYVFMDRGVYVELKGTLTGVQVNRNLQGKDTTSKVYAVHAMLGIVVESYQPVNKLPKMLPYGKF
jgi:hypothetical protein